MFWVIAGLKRKFASWTLSKTPWDVYHGSQVGPGACLMAQALKITGVQLVHGCLRLPVSGLLALLAASSAFAQTQSVAPAPPVVGMVTADPLPQGGTPANRGAAWKLLAGYQFSQSFGLEAAYGELGRYGFASGVPGLSAAGDVRMRAWSLAGTSSVALGKSWSLTGKLGVGNKMAELGRLSGPLTVSPWGVHGVGRSDLVLGLGLGYSVGRGFGLRFEYENFGSLGGASQGPVKADQWAVSLKYSF